MSVEINQIIRSKRKTLALIVQPDGSLMVRAPWRASSKSIKEFVERNAEWVQKKQADALASYSPVTKQFIPAEMFMYLGNAYPLEIVKDQKQSLLLNEKFKLAESAQDIAVRAFEHWYREQARRILNERVTFYAHQYNFQYKRIGITSARTRWGSCAVNGSLNFSWRLIMAPLESVDYVVIHELVHTIFHNHSKRFWNRVQELMPNYREHQKWLRENGPRLLM